MATDDLSTGSAPIRDRRQDPRPAADGGSGSGGSSDETRVDALEPVKPDAVSPEVRSDSDGPVRGGMTRDSGAGAAGGRDPSRPGGREPERGPDEVGGRGVSSDARD